MEDILEYLLFMPDLTVRNKNNMREVSCSQNLQDAWCVYEAEFEGGLMKVILESSSKKAVLDSINFEL